MTEKELWFKVFGSSGSGNSFLVQKIKDADQELIVSVNENGTPALLLALNSCKSDEVIFSLLERGVLQQSLPFHLFTVMFPK